MIKNENDKWKVYLENENENLIFPNRFDSFRQAKEFEELKKIEYKNIVNEQIVLEDIENEYFKTLPEQIKEFFGKKLKYKE